ncbi:60S acidic ribosomal protein P3-like [Impatiens glandulifera]|uniref:60S acidic ribosomal protein P3-like n=1 Tax=Impatiens glandulifera TaxID=253017 RepID=UPI001FB0A908|nr:60S acidic ribosomal protein P3-like [Impatiens glandulifera]
MGVFTFVCRTSGADWNAKQITGDLEASADSTFNLQRKLVQTVLSVDSSGGVQSSFSFVSPSSAIFQVIIGGGSVGGGAGAAAAAPAAKAAEAPTTEEKKEVKEESDEEDFNFSLFD